LSTTQRRTSQNSAFRQPFFHFAQGSSYFATSIVLAKESLSQELKRDGSKFGSTVESGERLFQPKMARKLRQINDSWIDYETDAGSWRIRLTGCYRRYSSLHLLTHDALPYRECFSLLRWRESADCLTTHKPIWVKKSKRRSPIRPRIWFRIPTLQTREQWGSS